MQKNKTIVPYAFIISLVVIIIIETVSYSFNRSGKLNLLYNRYYGNKNLVPSIDQSIIQWQIFNIRTNIKKQQDILFFGDSSCLMGLRPLVVMKETDLTAWNIGLLGSLGVEGHADVLDFYLRHHPPPKLAVYHISHFPLEVSDVEVENMSVLRIFKKWLSSYSLDVNPFKLQSPF